MTLRNLIAAAACAALPGLAAAAPVATYASGGTTLIEDGVPLIVEFFDDLIDGTDIAFVFDETSAAVSVSDETGILVESSEFFSFVEEDLGNRIRGFFYFDLNPTSPSPDIQFAEVLTTVVTIDFRTEEEIEPGVFVYDPSRIQVIEGAAVIPLPAGLPLLALGLGGLAVLRGRARG